MPFCSRCALAALALSVLAFTGCDSNNPDLTGYEGTYTINALTFTAQGVNTADVAARLDDSSEIDVRTDRASFDFEYADAEDECRSIDGGGALAVLDVAASRESLTFTARGGEDADALECLLLPDSFSLRPSASDPSGKTFTATFDSRADLFDYDRDGYNDTQRNVPGRVTITISRP